MTDARLGITVTSNADQATVDLDRLTASAGKAATATTKLETASRKSGTATAEFANRATAANTATAQLERTVDMAAASQGRMIAVTNAETAALNANASAVRNAAAARGVMAHNTNLMFQAQDIAMMTMMGQNPMMLAMQQGSQVGPILQQMGGGRQAIAGIGAALASLVSPINLITLGVIGFGAAGVQALMSMTNGTDEATAALEDHREWLDKVLLGYEAAADAASRAREEALTLPAESVLIESQSAIEEWQSRYERALEAISGQYEAMQARVQGLRDLEAQGSFLDQGERLALEQYNEELERSGFLSALARGDVDALDTILRQLGMSLENAQADEFNAGLLGTVDSARNARAEVEALSATVDNLPTTRVIDIIVRTSHEAAAGAADPWLQSALDDRVSAYEDAVSSIERLTPDLRTARQQVEAELAAGIEAALSPEQIENLQSMYGTALAAIDEQESQRAARAGAREAERLNAYQQATQAVNDNIASLETQALTFGLTEGAATRFSTAMELLRAAEEAGIPVTGDLVDQINAQADALVIAEQRVTALAGQQQMAIQINNTLASGFSNMFTSILDGSKTAGEAIGDLLGMLGQLLINQAFMQLFGAGTAGGAGGFLAGLFAPSANGNAFGSQGLTAFANGGAFTNSIVSQPTLFPFANGIGLMGEAGPEAIMPLRRGPDGRLGVSAHANGNASNVNTVGELVIQNTIQVPPGATEEDAARFASAFTRELRKQLPDALRKVEANPYRRHVG